MALDAILQIGGPTKDADQDNIDVVRVKPVQGLEDQTARSASLDLETMLRNAAVQQNVTLQPRDIIYVPATGIARRGRSFERNNRMITPFAQLVGAVGTLSVVSGSSGN